MALFYLKNLVEFAARTLQKESNPFSRRGFAGAWKTLLTKRGLLSLKSDAFEREKTSRSANHLKWNALRAFHLKLKTSLFLMKYSAPE